MHLYLLIGRGKYRVLPISQSRYLFIVCENYLSLAHFIQVSETVQRISNWMFTMSVCTEWWKWGTSPCPCLPGTSGRIKHGDPARGPQCVPRGSCLCPRGCLVTSTKDHPKLLEEPRCWGKKDFTQMFEGVFQVKM